MAFINIQCSYCGKIFKSLIKHFNKNKKRGCKNYCSKSCGYKARRKRIITKCDYCRKKFERIFYYINRRKKLGVKKNYCSKLCRDKSLSKLISGKNNPMYDIHLYGKDSPGWRGVVTSKSLLERRSFKNKDFIQKILKRDDFTCQICRDNKGGNLEIDHIMPWSLYAELRYNSENCRTLCVPCHRKHGANPKHKKWSTSPKSLLITGKENER